MDQIQICQEFGFLPFRRIENGKRRVHLTLRFESDADFHIDSSTGKKGYNLITHAHTDHYGQNNMKNGQAVASYETARILEAYTRREFKGKCFDVGETIDFEETKVRTYSTKHMHGSTAFLFNGKSKVLVTGDVKDYSGLPRCDVLVTEATYGSPEHVFEEELDKLVESAMDSSFGVYPIGKAQRVAELLVESGLDVGAEEKIKYICNSLGIDVHEDGDVNLISPRSLYTVKGRKYILTAQNFYNVPRIVVSDHVDYNGILGMVEHCKPQHVLFYHGKPSEQLCDCIEEMGIGVTTLPEIGGLRV